MKERKDVVPNMSTNRIDLQTGRMTGSMGAWDQERRSTVLCGMAIPKREQDVAAPSSRVRFETADAWLKQAVLALTPIFDEEGYTVPPIRAHLGWTSAGLRTTRIGECWPKAATEDGMTSIFITTQMKSPVAVLDVLMHEMVHAVDDCTHKHGKEFAAIGRKVGLVGPPWRSAGAGELLLQVLVKIADDLGHLPYSPIRPPVPATREMRSGRAICPSCGYSCRTLSEWSSVGPPLCPKHKIALMEDWRLAESLDHDQSQ